ncbi:transcriptional repressor [Rhodohalobacter sp. SW132]|uniref:Fur family transcriptional regulator n=1 Tax=Rhodohalobacter sp. SW132 TaxID=2293433 RepID=UPI000E25FDFF|nr:transcriptional repressor [Rhodohalobacter sp. SW132]REL38399.1 transcriptional repressor [Rhodohalobacter sp. SW132]
MDTQTTEKRLKSRNIQPTAMRLLVLDFLIRNRSAVSLSDLEESFDRSDRTTLYRTLKTFLEHGLVHQIHDESGTAKYALCAEDCTCSYPDDLHLHFYCLSCENTFCFPEMGIPQFNLPENFTPSHGNFVISGQCPSCPASSLQ